MKRFFFLALVLSATRLTRAETNLPAASALLLDNQSAFDLTAQLKQYASAPGLAGKLTSIGSGVTTILVNRWAAEFSLSYPQVELDIHGGGTADGLSALLEGKADMMPSGRPLSTDQIESFKAKFGYAPAEIV